MRVVHARDLMFELITLKTCYTFNSATGATPLHNAFFGQGRGPILLDNLNCTTTESRLVDCHHRGIGQTLFCRNHLDDAGLRCAECKLKKKKKKKKTYITYQGLELHTDCI